MDKNTEESKPTRKQMEVLGYVLSGLPLPEGLLGSTRIYKSTPLDVWFALTNLKGAPDPNDPVLRDLIQKLFSKGKKHDRRIINE